MIKIFCDKCDIEILDKNYVELTIFNNYDFEQSIEGTFCKKCWEKHK